MANPPPQKSRISRFASRVGWTNHSSILLGGFFLVVLLIVYVWWPLAEEVLSYVDWHGPWWLYMDWLLLGVFFFMSLAIMLRADLRVDALIILVGAVGGLVIESWGTQTNLWFYYTAERPPLWIIPAWPIASLAIDRITRFLNHLAGRINSRNKINDELEDRKQSRVFTVLYWLIFISFYVLMLVFVAPTFSKSTTVMATLLVFLLIITPTDTRMAILTFVAGSALGYFLERWGTTRQCWTYYTFETPPLFAVLAHGMAAVSFWRAGLLLKLVWGKIKSRSRWMRNLQKT
jgi:hypothetical protein